MLGKPFGQAIHCVSCGARAAGTVDGANVCKSCFNEALKETIAEAIGADILFIPDVAVNMIADVLLALPERP